MKRTGIWLSMIAAAISSNAMMTARGAEMTGDEILARMDKVLYSPKDKKMKMRFILIDKRGNTKEREMLALERGNDHRLMKFTAPADQKGISFLSLPNDVMYLYLPAFGKVRRIASHIKNKNFAGGDLSYEDLEAKAYAPRWHAKLLHKKDGMYTVELTPKKGTKSDYSRLIVSVKADNFFPVRVEYFDRKGKPFKLMQRKEIKKVGKYWDAYDSVMENLKTGHKTRLQIIEVEFDIGIPDEHFSQRYMRR